MQSGITGRLAPPVIPHNSSEGKDAIMEKYPQIFADTSKTPKPLSYPQRISLSLSGQKVKPEPGVGGKGSPAKHSRTNMVGHPQKNIL